MDSADKTEPISGALGQIALINRITIALSAAVTPADLAKTIAVILTSPLGLHFSRAFLLAYDMQRECFTAERVVGISSAKQARRLLEEARAEKTYLDDLPRALASHTTGRVPELLDSLKSGALLVEAMQRADSDTVQLEGWSDLHIVVSGCFPAEKVFTRLIHEPKVIYCDSDADVHELSPPLNVILEAPFVALPVHTAKGVRLAILADRAFQEDPGLDPRDLSLLEWFRAQLGMAWSGAEAYAELEGALAQLQELDALKNNFLSTVSHELRTPLTAILGVLNLVLSNRAGHLTEEQGDLLDRSRRQADHLLELVNDLLKLAELEANVDSELPAETVDATEALQSAMARVATGPRGSRANIVIRDRAAERCLILANRFALQRILYHLLDNAVKFSPEHGAVTVEVDQTGDLCHISIADQGIGIERSKLGKIFSLFYQVDARLSRVYPGMGIGLRLVKALLNATGGHIAVVSQLDRGSVFTVVYPLAQSTESGRKG